MNQTIDSAFITVNILHELNCNKKEEWGGGGVEWHVCLLTRRLALLSVLLLGMNKSVDLRTQMNELGVAILLLPSDTAIYGAVSVESSGPVISSPHGTPY